MTRRNFGIPDRSSPEERDRAALAFSVLVGGPLICIAVVLFIVSFA